jgi:hypothetical protein
MILYRFLPFQSLWSMEKTSGRDVTAGDAGRMVSKGVWSIKGSRHCEQQAKCLIEKGKNPLHKGYK